MSGWLRFRLAIDRAAGAIATVILSPIIGLLVLLVRRDGGPGLITVPRIGRGGETFGMWKIRSMRVETADGRAGGAGLTRGGDDRITPIGRRIRGLHLDELPQLINVARGEMSLLGPRPEAPQYVDLDDPTWQRVLRVPPGIAGPTQLIVGDWELERITAADDDADYREVVVPVKLAIDEWYVRRATLRTDVLVVSTLVRHTLSRPDTGALDAVVGREVEAAALPLEWKRRLP